MASILPLDAEVVNKIAAGEIIQRPCNAVKELLENSLDAGATSISITVKDGGMKIIQIQDDGNGIRREDLGILCHRHTTSKLTKFDDLKELGTLGFRGEALASISYVSHLTVITKRREDAHAWKAAYDNGEMLEGHPVPSAGVNGTMVTIDDLFYNVPMRKKAIKSASDEYGRILDVVSKYAIYHAGISMSLRKSGEARQDVNTQKGMSRKAALRQVYGADVGSNLQYFENSHIVVERSNEKSTLRMTGYLTGPGYSGGRKTLMILFINGRLVESLPLKRCMESLYSVLLPKTAKPFIFLSVEMPSHWIDVNIHPTKREVAMLHEDDVVDEFRRLVEKTLLLEEGKRNFVQSTLDHVAIPDGSAEELQSTQQDHPKSKRPDRMVRTDPKSQTLHEAFWRASQSASTVPCRRKRGRGGTVMDHSLCDVDPLSENPMPLPVQSDGPGDTRPQEDASVSEAWNMLSNRVETNCHEGVREILCDPVVIGFVDNHRALIQKGTRLYMMDISELSRDLFYQRCISLRGKGKGVVLNPPLSIQSLVHCALEAEEVLGNWKDSEDGGTKQEVSLLLRELLVRKASLLESNFGICISATGNLVEMPELIPGCRLREEYLPKFFLALGQNVDWASPSSYIADICGCISELYMIRPAERGGGEAEQAIVSALQSLSPDRSRSQDGTIIELTRLEHLYRVFERC